MQRPSGWRALGNHKELQGCVVGGQEVNGGLEVGEGARLWEGLECHFQDLGLDPKGRGQWSILNREQRAGSRVM